MEESEWSARRWNITVLPDALSISRKSETMTFSGLQVEGLDLRRRFFRWQIRGPQFSPISLPGLKREQALSLRIAIRRLSISKRLLEALRWHNTVVRTLDPHIVEQRWIPREKIEKLSREQPKGGLFELARRFDCLTLLTPKEFHATRMVDADLSLICDQVNQWILGAEFQTQAEFLNTIEKTPLTREQARAVLTFDNRVHVLAAAGSGKTSVMVARAAYAVKKRIVSPDKILVLAFNKAAAKELQERISHRFQAAGIDASGVKASTFHSFGLRVIGEATGRKPRLASFLDQGKDVEMVLRIVDELRDASPAFRYQWDLYRLLFANAPNDVKDGEPDGNIRATATRKSQAGFQTFGGEVVKSEGERMIANFLFIAGVEYKYEKKYPVDVANATHSQYHPDFYYPSADLWHEHWALDRNGIPPPSFSGYAQSMWWKRNIHALCETSLLETTWTQIMHGDGLEQFQKDLESHGIALDWNPDRPIANQWVRPIEHEQLARFIRSFMSHIKSNDWSRDDLEQRLAGEAKHLDNERTRRFLNLYWQIHEAWNKHLKIDDAVDFEDMLVQAARHLQRGKGDLGYDLVMVDEFQDASQARALLVQGLLKYPNRFLLAVGDDWQSINRFAGADVSIVQDFQEWFGMGPELRLTRTFRCTQVVSDLAREFITRNPSQLKKPMRSIQQQPGIPINIVQNSSSGDVIRTYLRDLSEMVKRGEIESEHGLVSVDVLGRFNHQRELLPSEVLENLQVRFRTVHSSKGLEADFIIVPEMTIGRYGFPSGIADDSILQLAMPKPEDFPHAEERRLFYVALTRARKGVTLIAPPGKLSPFIVELLSEGNSVLGAGVERLTIEGESEIRICPGCQSGTLVERNGPYGKFLGCTNYPGCRTKVNLAGS